MRILVKFCTQTYGFIVNPVSARNEHFLWIPVIDHHNLCGYYLCPISTATEALSYSYMYCSQIGYTIKKKHYSQSFDGCCFDKYNKQNNRV